MNVTESLIDTQYFSNLVTEQLVESVEKYKVKRGDDEKPGYVIQLSTAPLASVLKRGPEGLNPPCICSVGCNHISFFDAMSKHEPLTDFCPDRNTFLVHRLPCWLTGLKNKKEFVELPTVFHVFNVFRRGTYWWGPLNGQNNEPFFLSREARLILISCTGLPLIKVLFLSTRELLGMRCSPSALHRLKNWFITLDGLLISILLGSQGHTELCNWEFFDKVMQTYLKTAIGDLFKQKNVDTYYSRLKESRNLLKDRLLKERTLLEKNPQGRYFSGNFWYFNRIVEVLDLNVPVLTPEQLKTVAYITQTRASGLPPKPVEVRALDKFYQIVGSIPSPNSPFETFELSRAIDSLCLEIKSQGNFEGLMNTANLHSKISLSNSASFSCTRENGGKVESARILLSELPVDCPFFDLDTGKILFHFGREDPRFTPGEKLFHYSILRAITSLTSTKPEDHHIGDIRVSVVTEPGKARVITISTIEHCIVLHPLAHLLSVLLATLPSSKTGLIASNHMWDTFKRMKRENIPMDGIFSSRGASTTLMGSEDWETATDSINPYPVMVVFDGLRSNLGLPKFYTNLCKILLTMPRRIYSKEILRSKDYAHPISIKYTGILMGDPCCKQVLHLTHLLSRKVARNQLKRIGSKSITPPFSFDKGKNRYGSIPNKILLKKRLTKEDYYKDLKGVMVREEGGDDIMKNTLAGILRLRNQRTPHSNVGTNDANTTQ